MTKVLLVHNIDCTGAISGGIDSVVAGLIEHAPREFELHLVCETGEEAVAPVGKWVTLEFAGREVRVFSVCVARPAMSRRFVPNSLRFFWSVLIHRGCLEVARLVIVHRLEYLCLPFGGSRTGVMVHQDPRSMLASGSDVRWKYFPFLYRLLERALVRRASLMWVVRRSAQNYYSALVKMRVPVIFVRTWANPRFFTSRLVNRSAMDGLIRLIWVGRFDSQKDPKLAVDVIRVLVERGMRVSLSMLGAGPLFDEIEKAVQESGLGSNISLLGHCMPAEVAGSFGEADFLLLTSRYEGMPIAVLEAFQCGVPAVSVPIDGIDELITNETGRVSPSRSPEDVAATIVQAVGEDYSRGLVSALTKHDPEKIVAEIYGELAVPDSDGA